MTTWNVSVESPAGSGTFVATGTVWDDTNGRIEQYLVALNQAGAQTYVASQNSGALVSAPTNILPPSAAIRAAAAAALPGIAANMAFSYSTASLAAAPAQALGLSGKQYSGKTGVVDCGTVTLGGVNGNDWTFGLITKVPTRNSNDYTSAFIAAIGTRSQTQLIDTGSLSIVYSGQYFGAWNAGSYSGAISVMVTDDNAVPSGARATADTLYAQSTAKPLITAFLADTLVHGLFVVNKAGFLSLWTVDAAGNAIQADVSDQLPGTFAGIANKSLRLGGPLMPSIPYADGSANWGQPIQGVVIKNGHAATPVEMAMLMQGADARTVFSMVPVNGDRYWPGTVSGSTLVELVAGQNGTITGTGTSQAASITGTAYADHVRIDRDPGPGILPMAPAPATSSPLVLWGTRTGYTTAIQVQIVKAGSTAPATGTDIVDGWQTIATGVADQATWTGTFTATAAHATPLAVYDWEERHLKGDGTYTTAVRQNKQFSLGVIILQAGQSILQKFLDDTGSNVTIPAASANAVRFYQNVTNNSAFSTVVGLKDFQGWQSCSGYGKYGASTMLVKLATLLGAGVGFANAAIGGQSITSYIPPSQAPFTRLAPTLSRLRPQYIIWGNGQADATMTQAQRFGYLDTYLQQIDAVVQAAPGGPWPYTFLIFPISGDFAASDADPGPIRGIDMAWTASRNAARPSGVANCASVEILTYLLDEQTQDGIHPAINNHGSGILAERYAQTIAYKQGAVTGPGYGPAWDFANSKWTASGGVITVAMKLLARSDVSGLATGSGGATVTGGTISLNGGGTLAAASGTIISATQVNFTITGTVTSTVMFAYQYSRPGSATGTGGTSPTATANGTINALYDTRGCTIGLNEGGTLLPGFPVPPVQVPVTITAG